MKKLFGFICFWVAVGILLCLLIPFKALSIVCMIVLLLLGYNLYFQRC